MYGGRRTGLRWVGGTAILPLRPVVAEAPAGAATAEPDVAALASGTVAVRAIAAGSPSVRAAASGSAQLAPGGA